MRLTIVGCAPAWTRRSGRASSCYLVEDGGEALVLDLGQGAFAELARYRDPATVNGYLISHLHADHLVDLVPLRHYFKYEAGGSVALHGPAELRARVDGLLAETDFLAGLTVNHLTPGHFEVGRFSIEAGHVTHIPDSYAFRVTAGTGPGLVYSGDCAVADDLVPLVRRGDTFLCEAAFGAGEIDAPIHLSAAEAARVAAQCGADRLILTHIQDSRAEADALRAAAAVFTGELEVARPGLAVDIS